MDYEFIAEIRAICSMLSIEDYLTALSLPKLIGTLDSISNNVSTNLVQMRESPKNKNRDDDFRISRSDSTILTAVLPPTDELLRFKNTKNNGAISASSPMFHMGMSSKSKVVQKRGNAIVLRPKNSSVLTEDNLSRTVAAKPNYKEQLMHPLFRPLSPIESNYAGNDIAKSSPTRSSPSPTNIYDPLRSSSLESEMSQNSVRFDAFVDRQMDEQGRNGIPTIVLSRRDALRAAQDEILSKSEDRIRLARCGLDHGRNHRHMKLMREHTHDWVDYAQVKYESTPPVNPMHLGIDGESGALSARSGKSNGSRKGSARGNPLFDSSHSYAPSRNITTPDSMLIK